MQEADSGQKGKSNMLAPTEIHLYRKRLLDLANRLDGDRSQLEDEAHDQLAAKLMAGSQFSDSSGRCKGGASMGKSPLLLL